MALAQLKRHYNDVDIFVEDTGNHNMWLLISRALLPAGTKLESVNMLGGREAVTKACELDQDSTGRRKLYIIDGDFDFLLRKKQQALKFFYRIRANNIENLLIHEDAFIYTALEQKPKQLERALRESLAYSATYSTIDQLLRPLFIAYAVAHALCPALQTTGYPVRNLLMSTRSGPKLDPDKIRKRIISLYLKVARLVGLKVLRASRERIKKNAARLPLSQIASGKDYLLPLFLLRFQASFGYPKGDENFKVALARSFSPAIEPSFTRIMRNLPS